MRSYYSLPEIEEVNLDDWFISRGVNRQSWSLVSKEPQGRRPFVPTAKKIVTGKNFLKAAFVKTLQRDQIDNTSTILWPSDCHGNGGQMLRSHNPHAVSIPLHRECIPDRLLFQCP